MNPGADVLIVGGGAIGLSLARELARRGAEVVVIDRGEPGAEASSAAAGMLAPQAEATAAGPFLDLSLESLAMYPRWSAELEEETGIEVGFRRTGLLRCAFPAGGEPLERFLWQLGAGLRVERLKAREIPRLCGAQVADGVVEALFFPDEAIVDNRLLTRALRASLSRRRVDVRAGVEARRFLLRGGACRGVETREGSLEARHVVDAAGAWAAFDPELSFPIPVAPVRGQIVQLAIPGSPLATVVESDELYLVPRTDGSLLAGATVEFAGFEKRVTAGAVEGLIAAASRLIPSLGSASFVRAWAGLRPGTPDGLPLLGRSPVAGLFLATGHFRNGILLAPVTSRILADELSGTGRDLAAFSIDRFSTQTTPPPVGSTVFG